MATTQKNNHRSIRFTDEIAAIINAQEGENFNQKLRFRAFSFIVFILFGWVWMGFCGV